MNLSGWHSRRIALGTVVMTCLCLLILGLAPLWNTAHASTLTYMLTDLGSWSVPVQLPGSCGSSVAVNHVGLMAAGGTFTAADGTRHVEVCTLAILTRVRPKDQRADYTAGDFVTPMTRRCAKLGLFRHFDEARLLVEEGQWLSFRSPHDDHFVGDFSIIWGKEGVLIMKKIGQKAFAYITHQNRLLVFRHLNSPAAGIQVPAGTIKANELPGQAVLREAIEETGLTHLTVGRFLGEQEREMSDVGRDEIHHRFGQKISRNSITDSLLTFSWNICTITYEEAQWDSFLLEMIL